MTQAIKEAVALLPVLERLKNDSWPTLYSSQYKIILTALRSLEGVAAGTHVIVPVEPTTANYTEATDEDAEQESLELNEFPLEDR